MVEALAILASLTKMSSDVAELIRSAQEQARDLTPDELQSVRNRRDAAEAALDAEIERRREDGEDG